MGNGDKPRQFSEDSSAQASANSSCDSQSVSPIPESPIPIPGSSIPHSPFPIPCSPRFALLAGEASGDQLGAGLIAELARRHPGAQFVGVGGPLMRAAGLEAWHDCSELAVMGYAEVARHLPRLLRLRKRLRERLLAWRPDVFIGIDAPDFNLGLERALKEHGIRTVHYVSPSVWAWKERRAATIGRSADRVLCLFPMEPPIYAKHGMAGARYVGHPLADAFAMAPDRDAARHALALPSQGTWIAMLPGSRLSEIKRLGLDFLRACALLLAQRPKLHFVAPMANAACRALFTQQLARVAAEPDAAGLRAAFHLVDGRAHAAMVASDVVLLASGTAALEAMLAKRPMVVAYRVARMTQIIVRGLRLLKVGHYSLPNILHAALPMSHAAHVQSPQLVDQPLLPELMQDACTPAALRDAVLAWLDDPARVDAVVARFGELHEALRGGGSARAADAVDELLAEPR
ncbi:MAG: lipid-A-disaccharide synthase [Proteobacteria bacterium]|nr:lipid-A-disaccharide synthase [Pseudomonadota bacterium]